MCRDSLLAEPARPMYLEITVYSIHGTNQPDAIVTAVSSGCFRLL
jgi:lipoprotein-anchoring transpeptidase ErfK/SrfK